MLHNIPNGAPFLETLANFARNTAGEDFKDSIIFLPTRRACRVFKEILLGDKTAVELPKIRPIGDTDEDFVCDDDDLALKPAIPSLERNLLLAKLIQAKSPMPFEPACAMATELARLQDQAEMEELAFDNLDGLVPEQFSEYWQQTLAFLKILASEYPKILDERGYMNPVARKVKLIARQSGKLAAPFIFAAGSTGSLVPIRKLLKTIAGMPNGFVILPALDKDMPVEFWEKIPQSHPQYGLKQLIELIGQPRQSIPDLAPATEQAKLAEDIMLSGDSSLAWRDMRPSPSILQNISLLNLKNEQEEAKSIALAIRDAYHNNLTTHLITPSRVIAKQTALLLKKWNIQTDDSAGLPASETLCGNYFALTAKIAAEGFPPYGVLTLFNHTLTKGDIKDNAVKVNKSLRTNPNETHKGLIPQPPELSGVRPLYDFLKNHIEFTESIASSALYQGDFGEQLHDMLTNLQDQALALKDDPISFITNKDYPEFITGVLGAENLRPRAKGDPKIAILNSIEARLLPADFVIIAGLNEGVFPAETAENMWLSRPQRAQFGLPLPERKIGLSSHDFAEFLCYPKVLLTRSVKSDGKETLPSRWLQKLSAIREIHNLSFNEDYSNYILGVTKSLGKQPRVKLKRPSPKPPAHARPTELWATQIEKLYRDPYSIFASKILRLKKLDELVPDILAADFGTMVHGALEAAIKSKNKSESAIFAELERRAIPLVSIDKLDFWLTRFHKIAKFMAEYEDANAFSQTIAEETGELKLGDFTLKAKIDRIDVLPNGEAVISDYKTGKPPSQKDIDGGFSPQLPLEALIVRQKYPISKLLYLNLKQMRTEERTANLDETLDNLTATIKKFADANTPYLSRPNPSEVGIAIETYSDYNHLARVDEWDR